mgnify:CR=1 FL=1
MKLALGTKVSINRKDQKKGKIEIEYYSMEDLERLMDILNEIKRKEGKNKRMNSPILIIFIILWY